MYFPKYAASIRGSYLALRIGLNGRLPRSLNCPHPFSLTPDPNPFSLNPFSLILMPSLGLRDPFSLISYICSPA